MCDWVCAGTLVAWRAPAEQDTAVVAHDPMHGLPTAIFDLKASLASDGTLVMTDEADDLASLAAPAGAVPSGGAGAGVVVQHQRHAVCASSAG